MKSLRELGVPWYVLYPLVVVLWIVVFWAGIETLWPAFTDPANGPVGFTEGAWKNFLASIAAIAGWGYLAILWVFGDETR